MKWPFLLVVDEHHRQTGWALLNGPIVTPAQQEQFAELRRASYRLAGISSYMAFPRLEDGDTLDYEALCEAWCHCFRNPENFLTTSIPKALISVSDFTDYRHVAPDAVAQIDSIRAFDFIYVGGLEDWKRIRKNWRLASECIPLICHELGLRCLVIGEPDDEFMPVPGVTFSPPMPWKRLLSYLASARFLFVPNELDASPRLLAEALCLDVPVVVNRNILGGWKYVNRFTGTFFEDAKGVAVAVERCLRQAVTPRSWFRANYGPYLTGKRLLRVLRSVDPDLNPKSHLWLAEHCDEPALGR